MARMRKKTRAALALLALWLLLCGPSTPFFSERHRSTPRQPSLPTSSRYHFSCADEHINATLSGADVTRWMNPVEMVSTFVFFACVLAMLAMVVYLIALVGFCGCHLAVHYAIAGRQLRKPRLYTGTRRCASH